jgi:hypothetical protein
LREHPLTKAAQDELERLDGGEKVEEIAARYSPKIAGMNPKVVSNARCNQRKTS